MTQKIDSTNLDGWANTIHGMGVLGKDKLMHTNIEGSLLLNQDQLTNLYRHEGMATRIVDIYADEMTKQGWDIEGDPEGLLIARMEEIDAACSINELIKWGRLYGGSLAVLGLNDGQEFDKPVNLNTLRNIEFIHVYDRYEVSWSPADIDTNPYSKNFGQPEYYTINSVDSLLPFRVHHSRVLRYDGLTLPRLARRNNFGWGDSELQRVYDQLRYYASSYHNSAHILDDFVQSVLSINNLSNLVQAEGGEDAVVKRARLINMTRHVSNTILLDTNEQYQKITSSLSGIPEILDRFAIALAGLTGIPVTLLMGRSPAGMNATGDSDFQSFYDNVKQRQETKLRGNLEKLVKYLFLSKDLPFRGREPDNWKIQFKPLWQMAEPDKAAMRKTIAETDALYIDRGVLDPLEVTQNRFGGAVYNSETLIDMSNRQFDPEPLDATMQGSMELQQRSEPVQQLQNDSKDDVEYKQLLKAVLGSLTGERADSAEDKNVEQMLMDYIQKELSTHQDSADSSETAINTYLKAIMESMNE